MPSAFETFHPSRMVKTAAPNANTVRNTYTEVMGWLSKTLGRKQQQLNKSLTSMQTNATNQAAVNTLSDHVPTWAKATGIGVGGLGGAYLGNRAFNEYQQSMYPVRTLPYLGQASQIYPDNMNTYQGNLQPMQPTY